MPSVRDTALHPFMKWLLTLGLAVFISLAITFASASLMVPAVAMGALSGMLFITAVLAWLDWWLDWEYRRNWKRYDKSLKILSKVRR